MIKRIKHIVELTLGVLIFVLVSWGVVGQPQIYTAGKKFYGVNPLFNMSEIRNESSLNVEVIEDWHKVDGEVPTRQKLININVTHS